MNSMICIDASVVVRMLIASEAESAGLWAQWDVWEAAGQTFAAPSLMRYEVTAAFYRYQRAGQLSAESTQQLLAAALAFPVVYYGDVELHSIALALATEHHLPAAYDAHYLALAQRLGSELWTLDARLVRAVGEKLPWVRLLAG